MGLWEDDEETFRDVPDEAKLDENKQPMQAPPVNVQTQPSQPRAAFTPPTAPAEPEVARFEGDIDFFPDGDDEDFTSVLNDANLRIEQGRLYQMIMNHDLFDGMDANPKAVANVQREIRKFARESMEIMLGMREAEPTHIEVASPFNDLEVEILKKIASSASKGATESPQANEMASSLKTAPKRQTLNTIGGSAGPKRAAPQKPQARLPAKPATPVTRRKLDETIDRILFEEGVPREALEEHYKPLEKPFDQLTAAEQEKRRKETAARLASKTTVKSANALPMATPEQMEMLAAQRAAQVSTGPGMAKILEAVKNMPIKNQ